MSTNNKHENVGQQSKVVMTEKLEAKANIDGSTSRTRPGPIPMA